MKKSILIIFTLILALDSFGYQSNMFGDFVEEIEDNIKTIYIGIVGIVFLVSSLFNLHYFFGEHQDVKKGISKILLYTGGTALGIAIYHYLTSLSL